DTDVVDFCSAKIDESTENLAVEQNVIVPDVAKAGLERKATARPWPERGLDAVGPQAKQRPRALGPMPNLLRAGFANGRSPSAPYELSPSGSQMEPAADPRDRSGRHAQAGPGAVQLSQGHASSFEPATRGPLVKISHAGHPIGKLPEPAGMLYPGSTISSTLD